MIKQALLTTQMLRDLRAPGVGARFTGATPPEIEAARGAGQTCSENARSQGRGRQLGPPHLHIFNGLVNELFERSNSLGAKTCEELALWHKGWFSKVDLEEA